MRKILVTGLVFSAFIPGFSYAGQKHSSLEATTTETTITLSELSSTERRVAPSESETEDERPQRPIRPQTSSRGDFEIFQSFDPAAIRGDKVIRDYIARLTQECSQTGQETCPSRQRIEDALSYLEQGASENPGCGPMASSMNEYYGSPKRPDEDTIKGFDQFCLGAFYQRLGEAMPVPPPEVFTQVSSQPNLMSAIGIIHRRGVPRCAGLLTRNRQFITAKHCGPSITVNPNVVQASSGKSWRIRKLTQGKDVGVPGDWAVYSVDASPENFRVAEVKLQDIGVETPATFVAAYPYVSSAQIGTPSTPQAMRFPRKGMCHTIRIENGCIQMLCQTIGGFSGSPIFNASTEDGSLPEVLGFVSRGQGGGANCPALNIPFATLAVSANQIEKE